VSLSPLGRSDLLSHGCWQVGLLSLGDAGDDRAPHNLRRSLLPGMTLARYLKYLDAAARRIREGKASLNLSAKNVFERLSEEAWKVYPPGKAMARVG